MVRGGSGEEWIVIEDGGGGGVESDGQWRSGR